MKKGLLAMSIFFASYTLAENFVIVVEKENNYNVVEIGYTKVVEYTEWVDIGTPNCLYSPEASSVYNGSIFDQTKTCTQYQERDKNTYKEDINTKERTLSETLTESQNVNMPSEITSVNGEYKANSCLEIKNHSGNEGDGHYQIDLGSIKETVYCDMVGGWTLLMSTGSDIAVEQMANKSTNKNSPPSSADHGLYDYYPKMNDFFIAMDSSTVIKFDCKDKEHGTERDYYHKGVTDFNSYFNISTGVYNTTGLNCATNESFSQNSATDSDCLSGNNEFHRYYKASVGEYGWAMYTGNSVPKTLRHCGNNWIGDGDGNQSQGYIWYK